MQSNSLPERQAREHQPLMSIVKSAISTLTSQRYNRSGKQKSERALILSRDYSPAETLCAYGAGLQSRLPGLCPSIHLATEQPDVPTIRMLADAYDEETYIVWMRAQFIKLNEFIGTKEKLSTEQMSELSLQILYEYSYLNLFEIILFFGRLRSGEYEDFYGSIDPMLLLKSLKQFCADRRNDLDKVHNERERIRQREEEARHPPVTFDKWFDSLPPDKQEEVRNSPMYFVFKKCKDQVEKS